MFPDCEDFINDQTFQPPEESNTSSEEEQSVPEIIHQNTLATTESVAESPVKRGKKRPCNKNEWKKNIAKRLRNTGQAYECNSKTRKEIPARRLKPPCAEKCTLKCYTKISEEERQNLFSSYWNLGNVEKQRHFIASCMETIRPKYRYVREHSRRQLNNAFYFYVTGQKLRVCKVFFKNTLDINDRPIRTVLAKQDEFAKNIVQDDKRGKHGNHPRTDDTMKDEIRNFIRNIPKVESHYRRSQSTRHYIDGNKFITDLHRDYVALCKEKNTPFCKYLVFYRIFTQEFNIFRFKPKNDLCEECVSYENATDDEKEKRKEEYDEHLKEKDLARVEKMNDKEYCTKTSNLIVAVYDLEAVFQIPNGKVSVFYYKSKLNVFNFTIYNICSRDANCFVWHEGIGHRGVNELGTCVYRFLKEKANQEESIDVIFYSDNCAGQQKNKFMFSLYIHAVRSLNINSITHKFLIKGHTQNEGDSVHSTIENEVKKQLRCGPIYTPDPFITCIRGAKKRGSPYTVTEMSHEDFYDLKQLNAEMNYNLLKNTENAPVKVTDLKIIKVEKKFPASLFYKTSYSDESFKEAVVIRTTRSSSNQSAMCDLKSAFSVKPGISQNKKNDLLGLLKNNHIPKYYSAFFENL